MSGSFSNKLPELYSHPNLPERNAINRVIEGKTDNHGSFNCANGTTVTTVTTTHNADDGFVALVPMNSAARTEYLAGSAYLSRVGGGEFDLTHPSGSTTRTYRYAWIG